MEADHDDGVEPEPEAEAEAEHKAEPALQSGAEPAGMRQQGRRDAARAEAGAGAEAERKAEPSLERSSATGAERDDSMVSHLVSSHRTSMRLTERDLRSSRRLLGSEASRALKAMVQLAEARCRAGDIENMQAGLALLHEAVAGYRKALGEFHPHTLAVAQVLERHAQHEIDVAEEVDDLFPTSTPAPVDPDATLASDESRAGKFLPKTPDDPLVAALDRRLCGAARKRKGGATAVERLVAEGANPDAQDWCGKPAVYLAAAHGTAEAVAALARHGADLEATGGSLDETALGAAARLGRPGTMEELLHAAANINAADRNGMTALMWTASKGEPEHAKILLDRGANLTLRNNQGMTALQISKKTDTLDAKTRKGRPRVAALLR